MEQVAVIGIGCRLPRAEGPQAFWRLLASGGDAISEVPAARWDKDRFYDPDPTAPGKTTSRWGGFLEHVDRFDADFFSITAAEAAQMDPQQRLLLEAAWEAFEDAGLPAAALAGSRTGVFVGLMFKEYGGRILHGDPAGINAHTGTGNTFSIAANRISYFFDLKGPSLALDSACSSSLLAVHAACRSLAHGECEVALAGGVNVILEPGASIYYTKAGMMAGDGRCKAFDVRADGFVRGEGVGAVVLKPLARARADGDGIYAVVRGSAVNHDGRSNGLTAPNPRTQEAVVSEALDDARISPARLAYVEAHGTGTSLGDAMEARALGAVLGSQRQEACAIGSVKANIGHLEAAAGIASLIKAVLMLNERAIPPSLHFEQPNPLIPFADLQLRVPTRLEPLPTDPEGTVVGINAFGFGGTNAHLVLGGPPAAELPSNDRPSPQPPFLLPLSAASPAALAARAAALRHYLEPGGAGQALADVCYTAAVRRSHLDVRLALLVADHEEALAGLEAFLQGESHPALLHHRPGNPKRPRKLAFLFPDTIDAAYLAACRPLLQTPLCRQSLEQSDTWLRPLLSRSLFTILEMLPAARGQTQAQEARAAAFAVEIALVELWASLGVKPAAVAGLGSGAVAAAWVAGDRAPARVLQALEHDSPMPPGHAPTVPGSLPRVTLTADPTAAAEALLELGRMDYLELLPTADAGTGLEQALRRQPAAGRLLRPAATSTPAAPVPATMGALFAMGHPIDLSRLFPSPGKVLRLPGYPWQRSRHWHS